MGQQAFKSWTTADIPDLSGKVAVVTGANSGIGYHTALELARGGAKVLCVCRDPQRGKEAVDEIQAALKKDAGKTKAGSVELLIGDLSSLTSVKAVSEKIRGEVKAIDILVNNAGIMMLPKREQSPEGFEMQIATNHLGHFALTGRLLSLLERSPNPRIVNVSSMMAWSGNFKGGVDFKLEGSKYGPTVAYGNSKLANLIFTQELARRYPNIVSVASHPGGTATNLQKHAFSNMKFMFQAASTGALPSLRAATEPGLQSRRYFGPWFLGSMGVPTNTNALWPPQSKDASIGKQFWQASVDATGVDF